jgi:hypothetical protein
MSKKIKITESQLKTLVENTKKVTEQPKLVEESVKVEEPKQVNESIEKFRKEFNRFL